MRRIGIAVWVLLVITLAGLPAGVQAQGGDDGLVAEWHFDEGSGSVLVDSSGNGHDGVIYGATWVEGKYGNALYFDGVDDYVDIGDMSTAKFTIEVWFKLDSIHKQAVIQTDEGTIHIGNNPMQDNEIEFSDWVNRDGQNSQYFSEIDNAVTVGDWYHAALTSTAAGSGKMYLNGDEKFITWIYDAGVTGIYSNDMIGNGGREHYFNGIIDEVRIYNRALTADEIKSHYEGKQTALSLTKSAVPHSIKQGQITTVTLTAKNTGTTEITDIEVADTIPSDAIFIRGGTSKTYTSLRPKDSREFQYTIQLNEAGTFNLDPATATYSDEEGNYHTAESKTATITVIPSMDQPATPRTTPKSSAEISTASVHLHGEKTDVVLGEEVLLKLSAVNIIGNPLMHVQVIIIPPSGWSVTSSEFAKSGAGQYTTTYDIESGVGRDIEVRIMPNQIGNDFQVQGRIIYYFGDDSDAREDHTLTLPITVRAEPENGQVAERTADTSESESEGSSTPGFAAVVAIVGLLVAYLRRIRI